MSAYKFQERDKYVELLSAEDFHEQIAKVKGEKFIEYRRQWDRSGRFEEVGPVPLHLDFQVISACNFKCPMCPFGEPIAARPERFDAVKGRFPFDLYKKIIDEGVDLGVNAIDLSYYSEPLLHENLFDFIEYASKAGVVDIMMSTNGHLLTEDIIDKFLMSGLTRLSVSIDAATQDTYDKIRVGGDFHKLMKNLEYLLNKKESTKSTLPIVRVSFVKTKLNELELESFVEYWRPRVGYISIQELNSFEGLGDKLVADSRIENPEFQCHQPWHRLTIRPNGEVLPCCTTWGLKLVMGNLKTQTLREIWTSKEMVELRQLHKEGRYFENPTCEKCAKATMLQ